MLLLSRPGGLPVLNTSSPSCDVFGVKMATRCPLVEPLRQFSIELDSWLVLQHPGWYNDSTLTSYHRQHVKNFTLLQGPLLAGGPSEAESNLTLIRVLPPCDPNSEATSSPAQFAFTTALVNMSAALVARLGGRASLAVEIAGPQVFLQAAQDGVKEDMKKMDEISLPLALLIFLGMLRSVRLLLLPMLNIAIVVCSAFTLMYPISLHMSVGSTVPSLMLSAAIATSIDYSLFLLSRFREELSNGRTPQRAVEIMMSAAGHTVLVSGTTLALCFAGLAGLPIEMLRTMGIGAGSVAALSVAVNLTLTPTLLLTFPTFFSSLEFGGCGCIGRLLGYETRTVPQLSQPLVFSNPPLFANASPAPAGEASMDVDNSILSHGMPKPPHTRRRPGLQVWARIAGFTTRYSVLTIICVLLAALPFLLKLPRLTISADFALLAPRGAPCTAAYNHLIRAFGAGAISPYQMLLTPRQRDRTVADQAFFDDANALLRYLSDQNASTGEPLVQYDWLASVTGFALPTELRVDRAMPRWIELSFANYTWLERRTMIFGFPVELGPELELLWRMQVSAIDGNRTMAVTIRYPQDPFSHAGAAWLQDMRTALLAASRDPQCRCNTTLDVESIQLAAGGTSILDAISAVYSHMPLVVGTIFSAAFIVILIAFRSLLVPLRAVASLALTAGWVYGILIWIYQDGALQWTGISALAPTASGICWIVPVITFAVIVGLGLDYDVRLRSKAEHAAHMPCRPLARTLLISDTAISNLNFSRPGFSLHAAGVSTYSSVRAAPGWRHEHGGNHAGTRQIGQHHHSCWRHHGDRFLRSSHECNAHAESDGSGLRYVGAPGHVCGAHVAAAGCHVSVGRVQLVATPHA